MIFAGLLSPLVLAIWLVIVLLRRRGRMDEAARIFRRRALIATVALALAPAVGVAWLHAQAREQRDERCWSSGACHVVLRPSLTRDELFRVVAASNEECQRAGDCSFLGYCSAVEGTCVAATREDCKQTEHCKFHGTCEPVEGECRARSDADCRSSEGCRIHGGCTLQSGMCVPVTMEDCASSLVCRSGGACRPGHFRGCQP